MAMNIILGVPLAACGVALMVIYIRLLSWLFGPNEVMDEGPVAKQVATIVGILIVCGVGLSTIVVGVVKAVGGFGV